MTILGFDIGAALTPDVPLFETFARGLFMYLVVFVLIRYLLRGKTTASMADLLVLVLIADTAQNAMSADYKSLTNGLVLVGTIVGTSFTLASSPSGTTPWSPWAWSSAAVPRTSSTCATR